MGDVAELVGDDRAQLGPLGLGAAGCRRGRPAWSEPIPSTYAFSEVDPAAGVDPVDLADLDPGLAAELEHVGARLAALRQRLELVEDRRQHHRRDPDEDDGEPGGQRRRRASTSARGKRRTSAISSAAPPAVSSAVIPADAGDVPEPGAERLGREADVDRALVRDQAQRQGDRGGQQRRRAAPAAAAPSSGRAASRSSRRRSGAGRPSASADEHRALDREPADQQRPLPSAVVVRRARARRALK